MFSYRRVKNDLLTELPGDAVVGTRVIRLGWLDFRAVIDDGDVPRELSELVVPPLGSLEVTGDLFLQYRLVDSDGVAVESVAAFFAELAACGRPAATTRGARQHDIAADRLDPSPLTHANLYPTLTPTSRFRTLRSHTGPVNGVAFAPDGRTLATTSGPDRQMVGIVPLPQVRKR
jgi:hypothetical protein